MFTFQTDLPLKTNSFLSNLLWGPRERVWSFTVTVQCNVHAGISLKTDCSFTNINSHIETKTYQYFMFANKVHRTNLTKMGNNQLLRSNLSRHTLFEDMLLYLELLIIYLQPIMFYIARFHSWLSRKFFKIKVTLILIMRIITRQTDNPSFKSRELYIFRLDSLDYFKKADFRAK